MLSPLNWLLLALPLVAAGLWWRSRRPARALLAGGCAVALLALACMTPLVANALVAALERPLPSRRDCTLDPPTHAVVLAGGVDRVPRDASDSAALGLSTRRRVDAGAAWWHARPGRVLVMSGGPQFPGSVATATLMADYARRLGVGPQAVRIEGGSGSTWHNAHALARMQPRPPVRVALVTSAMHLRRADYAMRQAGFAPCAIASDFRHIPFAGWGYLLPRASALVKTEVALHEWVGLAYYRWRAWREA